MPSQLSRWRRFVPRLREEHGFSMVVTLGAMSMMLLSSAAAMTIATSDQPAAVDDRARKAAFAAAEAGLQIYVYRLQNDSSYWTTCEDKPAGLNKNWKNKPSLAQANQEAAKGTAASNPYYGDPQGWIDSQDPRQWKDVSDVPQEDDPQKALFGAQYTIETLPANGQASCNTTNPEGTIVDDATVTFRIRVTGRATADGKPLGAKRSIVATFKRESFLDYIYYTKFEVLDPATYASIFMNADSEQTYGSQGTVQDWGQTYCGQYAYVRGPNGLYRKDQKWSGRVTGQSGGKSAECLDIRFQSGDLINGPMRTNDSILMCGTPQFGTKTGHRIMTASPGDGKNGQASSDPTSSYRVGCNPTKPRVNFDGKPQQYNNAGIYSYGQATLDPPASNSKLADAAPPEWTFMGKTEIEMRGSQLYINGTNQVGQTFTKANPIKTYPTDGVIYVTDRTDTAQGPLCTSGYRAADPYGDVSGDRRTGCGIAEVEGNYAASGLTIGASADIVLTGNITRGSSSNAMLGLIANDFIRVYHPVTSPYTCAQNGNTSNASGSLSNARFDAALLTLTHSFIVDNWRCGSDLKTLTVNGAIAQLYRGPVGTSAPTGYDKNYIYDDRLKKRSPPKFLDPVDAAWNLKQFQEQAPAQ